MYLEMVAGIGDIETNSLKKSIEILHKFDKSCLKINLKYKVIILF